MDSDTWRPKIERYLDAELSDEETRAMDEHLRECSSCAAEALRQLQLRRGIKQAGHRYAASPEFRGRIAAQIFSRQPVSRSWRWATVPVAALALVAITIFSLRSGRPASNRVLAELTDLHVATLAASTPVDVVSSDRHTVKPWFQGKVPFTFDLPELAGSPFTLVGGRLTYLDQEPGAHLIYDVGKHHISVFIFRDQPELAGGAVTPESSQLLNFHIESWNSQGLRYFAVGDASSESIQELAGMFKRLAKD